MGKNKPIRNGFYFYTMEYKSKYPTRFDTHNEYFEAAGPLWKALSPEQKLPYEERAKREKGGGKVIKYTSGGINIDVIERKEQEKETKKQRMRDDIDSIVNVAVNTGRVGEELFYIIHVNYFCQYSDNKKFVPAELAVARFTLRDGVSYENVYHMIVESGPLQLGYSSIAKDTSEKTHKLPPPTTFEEEKDNMAAVLSGLKAFMREAHPTGRLPPVYAEAKNLEVVENVLENLIYNYGAVHEQFKLRVYALDYFFYALRNAVSGGVVWPQLSNSILELEKDQYDFCLDVTCSFHEVSDAPNHCSKSHVMRTAFLICDNCCEDLQIELIPGKHVPKKSYVVSSRPASRASSVASSYVTAQSIARQSTLREEDFYLSTSETAFSETSTVVDADEFQLGVSQNESAVTDDDNWVLPKSRGHAKAHPSSSIQSDNSQDSLPINLSQRSEVRSRRPVTLSAALAGVSLSGAGTSGIRSVVNRGRGRGFSDKM